jgi:5'-3' exonuclease
VGSDVIVVDGSYLTYRAFCAGAGSERDFEEGVRSMLRGSISTLLWLLETMLRDQKHEVVVAIDPRDGSGAALRRRDYPAYKTSRQPKPSEYRDAFERLISALPSLGIGYVEPVIGEADDAAATLASRAVSPGPFTLLWTADRDWLQLVTASVLVARPRDGGVDLVDERGVVERLGVPPSRVAAYQAIAGDKSDGYPGVPGVGPKRARAILEIEPSFVDLVVAGVGESAVRIVAARDASLAAVAERIAECTTLRSQLACATLRQVELRETLPLYRSGAAREALAELDCSWASERVELAHAAADDWSD